MRKLVVLMHISLDGVAASNEDVGLEWTFRGMSEEVAQAANTRLRDVDTAIFGRRTYEGMQAFWSTVPVATGLFTSVTGPHTAEKKRYAVLTSKATRRIKNNADETRAGTGSGC